MNEAVEKAQGQLSTLRNLVYNSDEFIDSKTVDAIVELRNSLYAIDLEFEKAKLEAMGEAADAATVMAARHTIDALIEHIKLSLEADRLMAPNKEGYSSSEEYGRGFKDGCISSQAMLIRVFQVLRTKV